MKKPKIWERRPELLTYQICQLSRSVRWSAFHGEAVARILRHRVDWPRESTYVLDASCRRNVEIQNPLSNTTFPCHWAHGAFASSTHLFTPDVCRAELPNSHSMRAARSKRQHLPTFLAGTELWDSRLNIVGLLILRKAHASASVRTQECCCAFVIRRAVGFASLGS